MAGMGPLSDNLRGALFMMASMAGFVVNDTLMKLASAEVDLFQAILMRGLLASVLIGALAARRGALRFRPRGRDRGRLALRVAAELGATTCFLTALFNMPIANATAILQAMPLAVTLAGALVMGEKVGIRRYSAIAIGFAGVLMIVRPGAEGFTVYSLWALGAVAFLVVRDLVTRSFSRDVPTTFVALCTTVAVTLMGGAVSLFQPWADVSGATLGLLAAAAVFLLIGYSFGVMAMRVGEIGYVSPFRYTVLLWALILGFTVFGERPSALTLAGAAIVVATGIYTVQRERRLAAAAAKVQR